MFLGMEPAGPSAWNDTPPFLWVHAQSFSRVWLCDAWTIAHQAPLSMEFSGKDTGVDCHFLLQGIFLTQGLNLSLFRLQIGRQILNHYATWEAPSHFLAKS